MVFTSATSNINLPLLMASTDGGEGGGDEGGDGGDVGGGEDSGGSDDSEPDPEPQPEPEPETKPEPVEDSFHCIPEDTDCDGKIDPEFLGPEIDCNETPENPICAPTPLLPTQPDPKLPPECEGMTPLECLGEKVGAPPPECDNLTPLECLDYILKNPPKPLPYCHKVPDDYQGACHDILDYDEETGLYPCNDGTQEEDWRDCPDAYVPPPTPCDPAIDPNCEPVVCPANAQEIDGDCVPSQCKEGYELVDGKCVEEKEEPDCPPGWEYRPKYDDCYKEIEIIINKIIKETIEGKHSDGFPDVDIIGLSVKQNGDAMLCAMNIDNGWVQCQEFGMDPQKVNQAFWRIIEKDSNKYYDNGNTGNDNTDLAIQDIKNHDFDELDDDRDNHDFGIDLGWVAINPQGDGVTCLTNDNSGEGDSLCEPFKVSAQDVDGQITEGVEFN
jgi:hypothetical protein